MRYLGLERLIVDFLGDGGVFFDPVTSGIIEDPCSMPEHPAGFNNIVYSLNSLSRCFYNRRGCPRATFEFRNITEANRRMEDANVYKDACMLFILEKINESLPSGMTLEQLAFSDGVDVVNRELDELVTYVRDQVRAIVADAVCNSLAQVGLSVLRSRQNFSSSVINHALVYDFHRRVDDIVAADAARVALRDRGRLGHLEGGGTVGGGQLIQRKYIYVDQVGNIQLMMPLVKGVSIASDNTCAMHRENRMFFSSAGSEIREYIKNLHLDLTRAYGDDVLSEALRNRLNQAGMYARVLTTLVNSVNHDLANNNFLGNYLLDVNSNVVVIKMAPQVPDVFCDLPNNFKTANGYLFSMTISGASSRLLRDGFSVSNLPAESSANPRENVLDRVEKRCARVLLTNEYGHNILKNALASACREYFGDVNFSLALDGSACNLEYFCGLSRIEPDDFSYSIRETSGLYLDSVLGPCAFDHVDVSPFVVRARSSRGVTVGAVNTDEDLSIMVQFLLAQANVYCYAQKILDGGRRNFGQILERQDSLPRIAKIVSDALRNGNSVEDAILSFVSSNRLVLGINRKLSQDDLDIIKERFISNYRSVLNSPHYDEFCMFVHERQGKFFSHQAAMCISFAEYALSFERLNFLPDDHCCLETIRSDARALNSRRRLLGNRSECIDLIDDQANAVSAVPPPAVRVLAQQAAEAAQNATIITREAERERRIAELPPEQAAQAQEAQSLRGRRTVRQLRRN